MLRTLVRIIALWGVGAGLFIFHGIGFHLTPWSQAIINAIVAYQYPPTGQEDTTVLLFTEKNLAELRGSFPVPYELHARVLENLSPPPLPDRPSPYRPRAVLIDFGFVAQASSEAIDRLRGTICALTKRYVGVYLWSRHSHEIRRPSRYRRARFNLHCWTLRFSPNPVVLTYPDAQYRSPRRWKTSMGRAACWNAKNRGRLGCIARVDTRLQ